MEQLQSFLMGLMMNGNMKLRLNTDGVFAFANTTESFARFYNEGVQIVSGSVESG